MADAIAYRDVETDDLVARFQRDGAVAVRVPSEHVATCAALIEICSAVRQRGVGPSARAALLLRGLYLTLRVVLFHSRLLNLTSLLVLEDPRCVQKPEPDGGSLFLFERACV
jgi:hypothetical protein